MEKLLFNIKKLNYLHIVHSIILLELKGMLKNPFFLLIVCKSKGSQQLQLMNVIEKGIKANQKYNQAEQYSKKLEGISRATNWFQTKTKHEGARRLIEERKLIDKQLQFGRRQLTIKRMTRLQTLYQKQYSEWQGDLRSQGLAILKNKL